MIATSAYQNQSGNPLQNHGGAAGPTPSQSVAGETAIKESELGIAGVSGTALQAWAANAVPETSSTPSFGRLAFSGQPLELQDLSCRTTIADVRNKVFDWAFARSGFTNLFLFVCELVHDDRKLCRNGDALGKVGVSPGDENPGDDIRAV